MLRIWDVFLHEGFKIPFRVALGMFMMHQTELLKCDNPGDLCVWNQTRMKRCHVVPPATLAPARIAVPISNAVTAGLSIWLVWLAELLVWYCGSFTHWMLSSRGLSWSLLVEPFSSLESDHRCSVQAERCDAYLCVWAHACSHPAARVSARGCGWGFNCRYNTVREIPATLHDVDSLFNFAFKKLDSQMYGKAGSGSGCVGRFCSTFAPADAVPQNKSSERVLPPSTVQLG
jgi:hypothetical protein